METLCQYICMYVNMHMCVDVRKDKQQTPNCYSKHDKCEGWRGGCFKILFFMLLYCLIFKNSVLHISVEKHV